jgi:hypothetical protein
MSLCDLRLESLETYLNAVAASYHQQVPRQQKTRDELNQLKELQPRIIGTFLVNTYEG